MATPTIPISSVIMYGLYAALPTAGMAGRLYFATDTKQQFYDNGSAWVNVTPGAAVASSVALTPSAAGSFTVAHGLAAAPTRVSIVMTSGGLIWLQKPTQYDATNLYLVASDASATGIAFLN